MQFLNCNYYLCESVYGYAYVRDSRWAGASLWIITKETSTKYSPFFFFLPFLFCFLIKFRDINRGMGVLPSLFSFSFFTGCACWWRWTHSYHCVILAYSKNVHTSSSMYERSWINWKFIRVILYIKDTGEYAWRGLWDGGKRLNRVTGVPHRVGIS